MFQPDIETLPQGKLRDLQNERLTNLINYVYERVPFYKNALDEKGIKPSDIRSVDDIIKLPITRKTDLRDNYPTGLFAVPMERSSAFTRAAARRASRSSWAIQKRISRPSPRSTRDV